MSADAFVMKWNLREQFCGIKNPQQQAKRRYICTDFIQRYQFMMKKYMCIDC